MKGLLILVAVISVILIIFLPPLWGMISLVVTIVMFFLIMR